MLFTVEKRQRLEIIHAELKRRKDNDISLSQFIKEAWHVVEPGVDYVHGWHVDAVADHLEAVTNGHIKRLVINIPPGCMKSLLTCVFWPAWEWGVKRLSHYRYISTSHKEALALRDNLKMRRLVLSDWYQSKYPHIQLLKDQNAKGKFENNFLGFREACASNSLTGSRGDRLIIDDPLSVDDARSKTILQSREEWILETVPTRLISPINSAIVLIMQRLAENDSSGIVLSKWTGCEHLMLPMEFEKSRKCFTGIGFEDPRTENNELLFPERFTKEVVDGYKVSLGKYGVAGQLQQRPVPRGGSIIEHSWWRYFKPEYDAQYRITKPAFNYLIQSWDTAFKEGEENDYSVRQNWGVNNEGAFLVSIAWYKLGFPDLLREMIKDAKEYNPNYILIEDHASGQSLIQSLKRETALPIKAIKTGGKDKEARLHAVSPFIESGRVFLPEGANFLDRFCTEIETFPRGVHDDAVDAMTQALSFIFLTERSTYSRNINVMGR